MKHFKCWLFGHDWRLVSFWVSAIAEVRGCRRCGREYATNHDIGATIPYDDEVKAFYRNRMCP